MKDIEIAVELLEKEGLTLAVVKNGDLIYSSRDIGIKPLYTAYTKNMDLSGSSVADRVTGKAAAMICAESGIKELKTRVISDNAINVLEGTDIVFNYDESTPYIKNRDKTGMCPVETLSLKTDNMDDLLEGIEKFLESISKKK